jgi:hypothetical protein
MTQNKTQVAVTFEVALKFINSLTNHPLNGIHSEATIAYIELLCMPYESDERHYNYVRSTIDGMLALKEFQLNLLMQN